MGDGDCGLEKGGGAEGQRGQGRFRALQLLCSSAPLLSSNPLTPDPQPPTQASRAYREARLNRVLQTLRPELRS